MIQELLSPQRPILLIDDEKSFLRSLSLTLRSAAGFNNLVLCEDSREALGLMTATPMALVLLDLTMPHLNGEELLPRIVAEHPDVPVIILSGLNQLETAVRCMKAGAFDYFVKTTETERLLAGVRRALAFNDKQKAFGKLKERFFREDLEKPEIFAHIVTRSRRMQAVFRFIEAISASAEPVLIVGESGVGKELIARAVHRASRPGQPWVAVNAAALDDTVFADTLFGHVRGAFTGADKPRPGMIEKAGDGVLFLDEIGDLSPGSQIKLLRLLQEGEYLPLGSDSPRKNRARIVCATNSALEEKMAAGVFRKDLYYRLLTHKLRIPPLRERIEDLPVLLAHFCAEAASAIGRTPPQLSAEIGLQLSAYPFPGNVRELRALVFGAVSLERGKALSATSFQAAGWQQPLSIPTPAAGFSADEASFPFPQSLPNLTQMGDLLVAEAMRRSDGNQTQAARLLGISRQALGKRLKKTS
ncbi:MAG: sigma-54 dependent transcriptional regulator [Desulfuromonadales bacterium]